MTVLKADIVQVRPRNDVIWDGTLKIFKNGSDNQYPTRVERTVNASVTASQCRKLFAKFIGGRGFEDVSLDDRIFGRDMSGDITGLKLLRKIADSLSYHNGVFFHLNTNIEGKIIGVSVLPFRYCRLAGGDEVTGEYTQVAVYNNWDYTVNRRTMTDRIEYFPLWNPEMATEVLREPNEEYKGMVAYYSFTDGWIYPTAPVDPAINDADTEAQIAVFKNRTIRNGFLDRTIFRHAPFENESDKIRFKEMVREFKGAESAEDILMLEDEFTSDNKDGNLRIDRLESKINDKLFASWEQTCPNNIRRCYNNAPPMLIDLVEGKLGGTSGEAYREAIDFYNDQTEEERMAVSKMLKELLFYWVDGAVVNTWIIPVGKIENDDTGIVDSLSSLSPLVATKVLNSMTTNEIRGIVALDPVEGGDTLITATTQEVQNG